jgi:endoglycosylceramidase
VTSSTHLMRVARRRNHKRGTGPRFVWRLALVLVAFAVWLVLPVPALTATIPSPARPPAEPGLPWLSVGQRGIADDRGRTVLLRGFNDDALLEPTMHPAPLDATDASMMQAAGFDMVRLPIAWSLLEPRKGRFDARYLERIARSVSLLNAHRLYVVLDMHFLGWSPAYGGSGAPAWATVSGVPDPVWGPMPSLGRFLSPAINVSTAFFWLTSGWQQEYLKTWQWIAGRFRDDSGVAGYDIINEPHSFPLPPLRFDKDQLFPFYARAVQAIGDVDPNHLFFLENDMTGDLPTSVVPLHASNLVYAAHVYTGSLILPAFNGDPAPLAAHIDELAKEAGQVPAPLWIGEFSINTSQAHAPAYIADILDDMDAHGAGWAWWQWREAGGWGVRSADGNRVNETLLRLLARPYLQAAPSGVSPRSRGDHRSLTITAGASNTERSVVVSWPEAILGAPHVSATCAADSIWEGFNSRLTISLPSGSPCRLEVSAAG